MKLWSLSCLFLLAWVSRAHPVQTFNRASSPWAASIVTLEISCKQYRQYQPWDTRVQGTQKFGIVIGEREILTTAANMSDLTLVRVQKDGRGKWWEGEVAWIDYCANLALVSVKPTEFWKGLKPVRFGLLRKSETPLQVLRWRDGNLESRRAEFTQFTVREGQLSEIQHVQILCEAEIGGVAGGEPLVADSRCVGLLVGQGGRTFSAMPPSFIQSILEARRKGQYQGLGYFHFYWHRSRNPESLAHIKLPGEPRGAIVTDVPQRPDAVPEVLKPMDVILRIDGFPIDIDGDYPDPEFGNLMLENLATRGKWAGDRFEMEIWRDGRQTNVSYVLPKYDYANGLVPIATYDQEPEYLIVGGLVFQPLTQPYLESWGADWRKNAPFRLNYYRKQPPTAARPKLVLLSQVLPDSYNIGYHEYRGLVLDQVNGQVIARLADLQQALQKPLNGFHLLQFMPGEGLQRIVIAAGAEESEATSRVLKNYGIREPSRQHRRDTPNPFR